MSITEYEIVVTEKGPRKVGINIKIGKSDFAPLTHFVFEDKGTEGVQKSMEERSGQYVSPEIVERARKRAIEIMMKERRVG